MSAATVTAVAAVASAGVAAYGASQAGSGGSDVYGSQVEPVPYDDRIGTEDSYAQQIYGDTGQFVEQGLPQIFQIANKVSTRNNRQRERYTGGTFRETVRQEGANILAMEQGQVPQDVIDSTNRIVAENLGGAFDPSSPAGGFGMSATSADAARRLGLSSLDMMRQGMAFGPSWRSNADQFIYKPQNAAADLFFPAANMALDASRIQLERDQNEYISSNNIARAAAMPDPAAVGSMNDSMIGTSQMAGSINSIGSALAGLIGSFGGGSTSGASSFAPAPAATPYIASARVGSPGVYSPGGTNLNMPLY